MKIALDLDGTLAQTYDVAFALMDVDDEYSYGDIESWTWGFEQFGKARYLNAIWHAWTLRSQDIKPMEDPRIVGSLWEVADQLDIVTADPGHYGIKESKENWLDKWDVTYDELVISPKGESKTELYDYDVFIDDNPHLTTQVRDGQKLLLRDAPYNQDVDGEYTRVSSLTDAYTEITGCTRVAP